MVESILAHPDQRDATDFVDTLIVEILARRVNLDTDIHNDDVSFIRLHIKYDSIDKKLESAANRILISDIRDRARRIYAKMHPRQTGRFF